MKVNEDNCKFLFLKIRNNIVIITNFYASWRITVSTATDIYEKHRIPFWLANFNRIITHSCTHRHCGARVYFQHLFIFRTVCDGNCHFTHDVNINAHYISPPSWAAKYSLRDMMMFGEIGRISGSHKSSSGIRNRNPRELISNNQFFFGFPTQTLLHFLFYFLYFHETVFC